MIGLREPLTSRGFRCGPPLSTPPATIRLGAAGLSVLLRSCWQEHVDPELRVWAGHTEGLDGALVLARTGGAYRTDYKQARRRRDQSNRAVHHKTSRFTGVYWTGTRWRASIRSARFSSKARRLRRRGGRRTAYDAAVVKVEGVSLGGARPISRGEAPRCWTRYRYRRRYRRRHQRVARRLARSNASAGRRTRCRAARPTPMAPCSCPRPRTAASQR